jgi:hypothetical protein
VLADVEKTVRVARDHARKRFEDSAALHQKVGNDRRSGRFLLKI